MHSIPYILIVLFTSGFGYIYIYICIYIYIYLSISIYLYIYISIYIYIAHRIFTNTKFGGQRSPTEQFGFPKRQTAPKAGLRSEAFPARKFPNQFFFIPQDRYLKFSGFLLFRAAELRSASHGRKLFGDSFRTVRHAGHAFWCLPSADLTTSSNAGKFY